MNLTEEQRAAIESAGKTIVSASAGSGKTFVMIKKLVAAIESGVDLDNVLAVTFTKKAASQMKDKLRGAIIERMESADAEMRSRLKVQLSKISSASISTIHAFCAKILRTYFYAVGVDGTFDIISADDSAAKEYKSAAIDSLFDRYYAEKNADFYDLLKCYRKKRSDGYLKSLILSSYEKLRVNADYDGLPERVEALYTEQGFQKICDELNGRAAQIYGQLKSAVTEFAEHFESPRQEYSFIFNDMIIALDLAARSSIFQPQPPLTTLRKPADRTDEEKASGEKFKNFRDGILAAYKAAHGDFADEQTERERFLKSGRTAKAFLRVLNEFDAEYTAAKRNENKLDYNDLEHLTLAVLKNEQIKREINDRYVCVFVDEYQDVNPVQEEIITKAGGENVFLVGDVKQAIYGFRGSKSLFFAEKYNSFDGGGGSAVRLSNNFRSSDGVLDFVNSVFSDIMTENTCGFDYSRGSVMLGGGGYPEGYGGAQIHVFGKDEEERTEPDVYSVKSGGGEVKHTREGRAVLEIVKRELSSKHFDLKSGEYVNTEPGDICILTRKRNKAAAEIVRTLTDAGYSVSGAQETNILTRPEVRQMTDILSYIDNSEQDIPLCTALLTPLGGMTCDELALIRVAAKGSPRLSFRDCCKKYLQRFNNPTAVKLQKFYDRIERLKGLAEVLSAAEIIDMILEATGLEAVYSAGGGEKLKNLRRLSGEGEGLSVSGLMAKISDGYEISAPAQASSDSIKIMTMHAAKGLEFPVVIIADICALYKGKDAGEILFDEKYGFAPRFFDGEKMLMHSTVLRRLVSDSIAGEEIKNEYNLFYVACTRAMCNLHIMAQDITPFNRYEAQSAGKYSKFFDMSKYAPEELTLQEDFKRSEKISLIAEPDTAMQERIEERFMREYAFANSVNLPVKSSASAILKLSEDETCYPAKQLFSGEGETGTERGTAYHRFLELCDFNKKSVEEINAELDGFVGSGRISPTQRGLLDAEGLADILAMPVFSELDKSRLFREQEFLCRLPADEILDTDAKDGVLLQGAIDLLAQTRGGYKIIDYKYSKKSDEKLKETYASQLALYKKAVALITHTDEKHISTVIVNIYSKRQINL